MPKILRGLLLVSLLLPLIIVAMLQPKIARGEEIPRAYRSAIMLGSGGAGLGSAEGYEALLHNPANLSQLPDALSEVPVLALQLTYSPDFKQLVKNRDDVKELQKKPIDFARYLQSKDLYFAAQNFSGAAFSQQAVGLIEEAHINFSLTNNAMTFLPDVAAIADIYGGLLYGLGGEASWLGDDFTFGANIKVLQKQQMVVALAGAYLFEQQSNNEKLEVDDALTKYKGMGVGSDIALNWQPIVESDPKVSVVVRNIGGMAYSGGAARPASDKQTIDMGFSWKLVGDKPHDLQVMADFEDLLDSTHSNFYKRLHLGARYTFFDFAGISMGLNQGYPTYGVYLGYSFAFLEYSNFTEERGVYPGEMPSKRSSCKFKLGWWL